MPTANAKNKLIRLLLAALIILNITLTLIFNLPLFDLIVSITGIIYVVILAERSIFNFLASLINVTLYIILCYREKIYGEVIFYLLFDIPITLIAFLSWRKVVKNDLTVPVKKLQPHLLAIMPFAVIIFALIYGLFLRHIGGEHVYIDALSTGVTIVTTLLLWKRFREQWFGWIVVYIVSTILWISAGNLLMVTMSIGGLLFSIFGLTQWWHYSRENPNEK